MSEHQSDSVLPVTVYSVDADVAELVRAQLQERAGASAEQKRCGGSKKAVVDLETRAVRRFQVEAAVDGHRFLSDEGAHGGGTDTGPAPLRYFVAGIAMCAQVWIVKMGAVAGVPITGLRTRARAFLEPMGDGPRGFERIDFTARIDTDWAEDRDEELRQAVAAGLNGCPAYVTASRSTRIDVTIVHNGRTLPAGADEGNR